MNIIDGLKRSIAGGLRLSFAEVGERVNRLSSAPGGRAAILALNSHSDDEPYDPLTLSVFFRERF